MPEEEKLYSISEVARELSITRDTVYDWIERGIVKVVHLKKRQTRITQETLDYLRTNIIPADQRPGKVSSYLLGDVRLYSSNHNLP